MNFKFLIVGRGRLAKHLKQYFSYLNYSFCEWHKDSNENFLDLAIESEIILLAISDDSIADFYDKNAAFLTTKTWVHFSGSLYHPQILGVHPLMTFSNTLYAQDFYEKIHLTIDRPIFQMGGLKDLFKNPLSYIPQEQKAFYHALCVMAGNFPQVIWKQCEEDFKNLNVPNAAIALYLGRVTENFLQENSPITGPLVRKDFKTVKNNLASLKGHTLHPLYFGMLKSLGLDKDLNL